MPENYEVVYTHPTGATATFIRHDGELDALAKALDSEQFWVFKNVKSLLVRNDVGDLAEANRLMRAIGFSETVREITKPQPVAVPEPVAVAAPVEEHHGLHLPGPSYWPILLGASVTIALGGWLTFQTLSITVIAIGMVLTFICMIGWGLEQY
ncbi:MAG: hypothetical protein OJF49_000169 [Ktedonobacterales bacterium]|jgi:hypothetical protein|nr:MAG: hypothetical protein OJF49_000169 [Ktedonobacterales bacterium]